MLRHGQTAWNVEGRLQGQADTDINALGRSQADRNGARLAELVGDAAGFGFVASPLVRTRETMERVRAALGLAPKDYRTDPRLLELHFGDWQGYTYEELEARDPGCTAARMEDKWDFVPPGRSGESYAMLAARVKSWFDDVGSPTVCVTHGGVIRSTFHLLGKMPADDAATMSVPQNRVLRIDGGTLEWL